jgi:hypothetical protein
MWMFVVSGSWLNAVPWPAINGCHSQHILVRGIRGNINSRDAHDRQKVPPKKSGSCSCFLRIPTPPPAIRFTSLVHIGIWSQSLGSPGGEYDGE